MKRGLGTGSILMIFLLFVVLVIGFVYRNPILNWYRASNFPYDLTIIRKVEKPENSSWPTLHLLYDPTCSSCLQFMLEEFLNFREATAQYLDIDEINVREDERIDKIISIYRKVFNAKSANPEKNISDGLPTTLDDQRKSVPVLILEEQSRIVMAGYLNDVWYPKNPEDSREKIKTYVLSAIENRVYQPVIGRGDEGLDILQKRPILYKLESHTNWFPFLPADQKMNPNRRLSFWPWQFSMNVPSVLIPAFGNEFFFNSDGSPKECNSALGVEQVGAFLEASTTNRRIDIRSAPVWDPNYQNVNHLQRNCPIKFGEEIITRTLVSIAIITKQGYEVWWVFKDNLLPLTREEQLLMAKAYETLPAQASNNPAVSSTDAVTVTVEVPVERVVEKPVPVVVTATPEPVRYYKGIVTLPSDPNFKDAVALTYLKPDIQSQRIGQIFPGLACIFRKAEVEGWLIIEAFITGQTEDGKPQFNVQLKNTYIEERFIPHPWEEVQPW